MRTGPASTRGSRAPRRELAVEAAGVRIAATAVVPDEPCDGMLVVGIPGGGCNRAFFDVPGVSTLEACAAHGWAALALDRPNYGDSGPMDLTDETFAEQSRLLTHAIASFGAELGTTRVGLAGHSIGGMISLLVAAGDPSFGLVGVTTTGAGAAMPSDGLGESLATGALAGAEPLLTAPDEVVDGVGFGPEGTYDPETQRAARASYAPVPAVELAAATRWPEELRTVAPRVTVPVQSVMGEFDALWDVSPQTLAAFVDRFPAAPFVDAYLMRDSGHSVDHHHVGPALHLRQIAFLQECLAWSERHR